jgi:hypothetical protein
MLLFKDLSNEEKIVYHVIRRIKNHKTQSFFHSVKKIADIAGISERWCQYALAGLVEKKILQKTERIGHTSIYKFINEVRLAEDNPRTVCTPLTHTMHPTPAQYAPITTSALTDSDLTTANKNLQSYNYLVKKFSKDVVDVAVENCKKLNGDAKNFWGLVHWSCKTGIAPTNKNVEAKEAKVKHNTFVDEQIEKQRTEIEQRIKDFEKSDPELPNKFISDFLSKIGD